MPKRRVGLQKDISSIFKGVAVLTEDSAPQSRPRPILEPPQSEPLEPAVSEPPLEPPSSVPAEPVASEPPAPMEPEPQPEIRPLPSPVKVTPPRKPKMDVVLKAPKRAPWHQKLREMKDKFLASKPGASRTRQKATVVLIPILAIMLLIVLTRVFKTSSPSAARGEQKEPDTSAIDAGHEIDWQIPPPYRASLRDPMQVTAPAIVQAEPEILETQEPEAETLIVKSILHSQSKPSAVIGSQIAHEGDTILGATVIKIDKDTVEFEKNGERWTQEVQR
jgi:hypothetical protein